MQRRNITISFSCLMVLHLIGIGLNDERDITVKGLDVVKNSSSVYLESYTSKLNNNLSLERLESFYGKKVEIADRETVELGFDSIIKEAVNSDVAFLVIGDPFSATTHSTLLCKAREFNVKINVIHNSSVITAVGKCGLQLYNFGQAVSIAFHTETWKPLSFFDMLHSNIAAGLHTLCLLDIKVKERSVENILRDLKIYDEPRFMTINTAISQIFYANEERKYDDIKIENLIGVGFARIGAQDEVIKSGTLKELAEYDFGEPLHSLVIPGKMHFLEEEIVSSYAINPETFKKQISIE